MQNENLMTEDQWRIIREVHEKLSTAAAWPGGTFDAAAEALKPPDGEDNGINASSQWLYYSTQTLKFDPSLVSLSPNFFEITPTGISIMGKERITWKALGEKLLGRGAAEEAVAGLLESGDTTAREPGNRADQRRQELDQFTEIQQMIGRIERDVRNKEGQIRQAERMARQAQGEHQRAFLSMRNIRQAELRGLQQELDRVAAVLDGR
ncbi:hypothetical protein ACFUJR_03895 [Streptomyces sp. NPDC057271]|uniref:hypothetical protein n=1 Tax=unclassified Streptomyces TaxID=2593676 RepID=UPI00363E192A